MGPVANTCKNMSNGAFKAGCPFAKVARGNNTSEVAKRFTHSARSNFKSSSNMTPIVTECSDLGRGIA